MRKAFVAVLILVAAACGGSSPTAPVAPSSASATAPAPAPGPTPAPAPTPCTAGLCEGPTTNTANAVRCSTRLYWVKRPGTNDLFSDCRPDDIPLGWQFALDTTCKDAHNTPTNAAGQTYFRWDGTDQLLDIVDHGPFQLWCTGIKLGHYQQQIVVKNVDGTETRGFWFHGDIVPEATSKCGK